MRFTYASYLVRVGALAVIYVLVARLGLQLDAVGGFATLVWPPSGIALAVLLLFGRDLWPGVAIGAFVVNVWTGAPVPVAFGMCVGNTLEALLGAWALRRVPDFTVSLENLRSVLALIVLAAVLSTTVSATIGVVSLVLGGVVPATRFGVTWTAWWLGDVIGDLVVAPVLLTWSTARSTSIGDARVPIDFRSTGTSSERGRTERHPLAWRRPAEVTALAVALVAASGYIFGDWFGSEPESFHQAFMLLPLLIFATVRFGLTGASRATFLVSALAIAGTALGHGPFVRTTLAESLTALQAFVAMTAVTFLILGAVTAERERTRRDLVRVVHDLEEAVRLREDFLSIAAHELRTPLTPLRLQVESLMRTVRRTTSPFPPDQLIRGLARMEHMVLRLETLIARLLDASRITAGRLDLEPETLDLADTARNVVARLGTEITRSSCTITLRAEQPVWGRWDRMRIEQVVENLVSNAIKYGAGRPVDVVIEGNGVYGRLSVRDQGIGIALEEQARIFERFARASALRNYAGFGLGLWIVRQIVDAHGGTITVHSQPGEGASFTVDIPIDGEGSQ
jgi:signal transduction histidine kinase